MEEKRAFLVEALARKARAIGDISEEENIPGNVTFNDALKHLNKWQTVDASNKKFAALVLQKYEKARQYGSSLKLLNELLKNNGDDTKGGICPLTKIDLLENRTEALKNLNYSHLVDRNEKWKALSSPKDYLPF